MASLRNKPHVSAALAHLVYGVTAAAVVLALCATVQLLVFGIVHFTNLRYAKATHPPQPIAVVQTARPAVPGGAAAVNPTLVGPSGFTPVEPTRVAGELDPTLHTVSDMAVTAGVLSGVLLAVFASLGAVIAGGSGVPGVQRAVSGATWAMLIAAACLPWHDILPTMSFRGALADYGSMTTLSSAVDAGTASSIPMYTGFVLAPLAALCGALLVLARFRQGIAEGVIVTSISELDERLEREMAGIRMNGVGTQGPRAVAALNQAIGEKPSEAVPVGAGASDGEGSRKARTFPLSRIGRGLVPADDDFKRPI